MESTSVKTIRFGDFELDRSKRQLRKRGTPISLNAKSFDLLLALVERRGEIVTKEELFESVWPGQFVEEGNLTVQVSTLRKIFGERKDDHRFIVTVPGRGYSFVADVEYSPNTGIVIERHSLSRIVIDEETTEGDSNNTPALRSAPFSFFKTALVAGALLLVSLLAGGYVLFSWNSRSSPGNGVKEFEIKRLTTNGRVSFAALSPDGKMFAYALKELEQNSLWLGFVEGGEDKMLRPSETGRYNDLAFSADGNFVLFTFSGADSRESILYRMPVFGGPLEKIRNKVASFCLAPDGKRYSFRGWNGDTRLNTIVVATFGSDEETVIDLPGISSLDSESGSWSPDGQAIAFGASPVDGETHDQIFLLQVADRSLRRVTNYGWKEVIKTAWMNVGENALLVIAQEKNSNTSVSYSQLWRVDLTSGEANQLTRDLSSYRSVLNSAGNLFLTVELRQMNNVWVAPSNDLGKSTQVTFGTFGKYDGLWGLDWTADGKIVFTSTDHQSQVISQMDSDGSNVRQLTPPGYDDSMVNASADGRYIVFQSTRAGGSDIWRMDGDGGNVVRITTDGKSSQPFISPDSRFVFYKSNGGAMHRVPIDGGPAERLTEKEVSYLSLSPDGTLVAAGIGSQLVVLPVDGGPPKKEFDMTRFGTVTGNTRWSADGKMIAYRDRGYGYWLQPVDGGEPQRMKGLPMEKFYNFAWSKDGKWFAFVRGQEIRDVVLFRQSR
jgi:DNA-binding winged helix-turn-helix (wHTH) protein/Tol biopolymer transport system component